MPETSPGTRRRLLATLFAGVGLTRTGFIAAITVTTLVTKDMLGSATLAGLPAALAIVGTALGTRPTAALMASKGRRPGLVIGQLVTLVGAVGSFAAVVAGSFPLLLVALVVFGAGNSADRMARYAAADVAGPARASSAVALIVWAGTIGSVAGPALLDPMGDLAERIGIERLAGPYAVTAAVAVIAAIVLHTMLRPDPLSLAAAPKVGAGQPRARLRDALTAPVTRFAIVSLVIGQFVMVVIMAMTPIHIRNAGIDLGGVGLVISAHTLGMFAMSPLTGWMADRVGRIPVILAGQAILVLSALMASVAAGDDTVLLVVALFLLGLGWNFGFVAGSALLATGGDVDARIRLQGLADSVVWSSAALASLASGVLLIVGGFPLVTLAGAALIAVPIWVFTRDRRTLNSLRPSPAHGGSA